MNFENIYPVEVSEEEKRSIMAIRWHDGHKWLLERLINDSSRKSFGQQSHVSQINRTLRLLQMNLRLCQNRDQSIQLGTIVESTASPIGRIKYR